jgi:hypothetical protein
MENLRWMASAEDGAVVVRMALPAGVPLQMIAVADIGAAPDLQDLPVWLARTGWTP